jgi:hypothetical protein
MSTMLSICASVTIGGGAMPTTSRMRTRRPRSARASRRQTWDGLPCLGVSSSHGRGPTGSPRTTCGPRSRGGVQASASPQPGWAVRHCASPAFSTVGWSWLAAAVHHHGAGHTSDRPWPSTICSHHLVIRSLRLRNWVTCHRPCHWLRHRPRLV